LLSLLHSDEKTLESTNKKDGEFVALPMILGDTHMTTYSII